MYSLGFAGVQERIFLLPGVPGGWAMVSKPFDGIQVLVVRTYRMMGRTTLPGCPSSRPFVTARISAWEDNELKKDGCAVLVNDR